jgi:exopolysaccharide biosynthesis polyprenyl glycosylphosphotransferase
MTIANEKPSLEPGSAEAPSSEGTSLPPVNRSALRRLWARQSFLLAFLDFLTVIFAFLIGYYLRFYVGFLEIKSVPIGSFEHYLIGAVVLATIWVFLMWRDDAYAVELFRFAGPVVQIKRIIVNAALALGVLMIISFMYRELLLSRQVYLMTGAFGSVIMILNRRLARISDQRLADGGKMAQKVLFIGQDESISIFAARVGQLHSIVQCIGWVDIQPERARPGSDTGTLKYLGSVRDIRAIYEVCPFDKVVMSSPDLAKNQENGGGNELIQLVNFCEEKNVSLYMIQGLFSLAIARHDMGAFGGIPMMRLQDSSLHPVYGVIKRFMDVVVSLLILILGMPLWAAVAIAIKMTSRGPVLFTQVRIGLHGRPFKIYKFRTMVADAEERLRDVIDIDKLTTPGFKIKNDPRVTGIGRFLRSTSIDEIPQVLNVLRGEMSLVGPRPEMADLVAKYSPEQRRRLKARPGITGYQQVIARGIPLSEGVQYDLIYLKNQSLLLDLYILIRTAVIVVAGRGVTH